MAIGKTIKLLTGPKHRPERLVVGRFITVADSKLPERIHPQSIGYAKPGQYSWPGGRVLPFFRSMELSAQIRLEELMIHGVGNAGKGDALQLTDVPAVLNDVLVQQMLVKWFTASFDPEALSQFTHPSQLALNELYSYAQAIFADASTLAENSKHIAAHLYKHSTHVKIKSGELYVALLHDFPLGDGLVKALGIFKSEKKDAYLKVFPHGKQFALSGEEGINIHKVEKGVLILNAEPEDGYRLLVTDAPTKAQDTRYFTELFLQAQPLQDSYHHTKAELTLVKQFVEKSYPQQYEVGKAEQIDLMQRSLDYFAENERFTIEQFTDEVLQHDDVKQSFQQYRTQYAEQHQLPVQDDFDIHLGAYAKQRKQFKSVLKLDKNFHVYIHGRTDLIEKGTDPLSGKQYYKLYFDEES